MIACVTPEMGYGVMYIYNMCIYPRYLSHRKNTCVWRNQNATHLTRALAILDMFGYLSGFGPHHYPYDDLDIGNIYCPYCKRPGCRGTCLADRTATSICDMCQLLLVEYEQVRRSLESKLSCCDDPYCENSSMSGGLFGGNYRDYHRRSVLPVEVSRT